MVLIETSYLLGLAGMDQLSSLEAILRAVVGLKSKAAVGPQLALGSKAMRGLDQRDQQSRSDRTDSRNLTEYLGRAVFSALLQEIPAHLLAELLSGTCVTTP